ncbi:MAG: phosphoadenylyl-sulfate reductase [Thermodesulfobacteriota bacterium]
MKYTENDVKELNQQYENKAPEEILSWAFDNFHPNIVLASSFQAQGVALIDLLMKVRPDSRIVTLDTGRLPQETYDVMDKISSKYNVNIEVIFPDKGEVEEMVNQNGINLFYKTVQNRRMCCSVRKTNPLNKFLKTVDAWITSIRKNQTDSRSNAKKFEIDYIHGRILKINPLVDWAQEEVWDYVKKNEVPYNKLHDLGYPSIGCAPCTRAIKPGEDTRAGRWWWEIGTDKECGIHFEYESN